MDLFGICVEMLWKQIRRPILTPTLGEISLLVLAITAGGLIVALIIGGVAT